VNRETSSPVAKLTSIRFLLSIATTFDLEIEQMDVKTTILHGDLKWEIYMTHTKHYVEKGKESLVCKLKIKSLYDLKQSPKMWYQKFDSFVLGLGFMRSKIKSLCLIQIGWRSFPCYHPICR
jgi:hypothetical protein